MKKLNTITLIILLLTFFVGTLLVSAQTEKKGSKRLPCNEPPETQIVNNSGKTIYKIKVGTTNFSKKLPKGSSTGFKEVFAGKNQISVKFNNTSPWRKIGTLGKFVKCSHYAVNIYFNGKSLCATLALRQNTDATYAADRTKRIVDKTCSSLKNRRIE